ncbi:MAG: PhoH family protein [Saprospiraceae bacterium]|nr:PhoH family protein [Saprospiraceae bacterium]
MSEIVLKLENLDPRDLFGENNVKLKLLREAFPDVQFTSRGHQLKLKGDKKQTQKAKSKFEMMVKMLGQEQELSTQAVVELLNGHEPAHDYIASDQATIVHGRNGRAIKARTLNQRRLVEAVENNDIVFAVGPAGTGKTYTAVALAVRALKNRWVKKIILTRPAVEAGESLGFLPGDLKEKIDPYLRPLYDALDDMIPFDKLEQFMSTRIIEVAPLAFMRGRTLDHAFIILDEAQNSTVTQLKMFLTRLGPSAKCIVTGDLSQIDLPRSQRSGLRHSIDILSSLRGISTVYLTKEDVVRHRLVKEIIHAYDISQKQMIEEE